MQPAQAGTPGVLTPLRCSEGKSSPACPPSLRGAVTHLKTPPSPSRRPHLSLPALSPWEMPEGNLSRRHQTVDRPTPWPGWLAGFTAAGLVGLSQAALGDAGPWSLWTSQVPTWDSHLSLVPLTGDEEATPFLFHIYFPEGYVLGGWGGICQFGSIDKLDYIKKYDK